MTHRPPTDPPDDPPKVQPSQDVRRMLASAFGLSRPEFDELVNTMMAVVRKVGCPAHIHPLEVVHDAFIKALDKPISKRRSSADREKFVGWMCELARYAALTNRGSKHRKLLGEELTDTNIATALSTPAHVPDVGMRKALEEALALLDAEDLALLRAHYVEDKTVQQIADEQNRRWSTVDSRLRRVRRLLRAAMQSTIIAFVLFVAKNARAQGARLARHVSRLLPHATHAAGAITVAVVCGIVAPGNSTATPVRQDIPPLVALAPPETTTTNATAPPLPEEVAPVKPIGLDELGEQWSASAMKSTKFALCLQTTVVPFGFLLASAMTAGACAGTERQTPPPQEPEEEYDPGGMDPYDMACESETARGNDCLSKEEWCAKRGMRPARHGCK
ncbi:MAG: hypothetical protein IPM54_08885 [Polyangiaceae bacterium]|nr:hypothetical protein [Polyangiaceae bacterium]